MKILILTAILSLACTTKVSEWVLLNAPADQYTLIYFYSGQINETARDQNASIDREIKPANIEFRSVEKKDIIQPYYTLYYGNRLFRRYNDPKDLARDFKNILGIGFGEGIGLYTAFLVSLLILLPVIRRRTKRVCR